MNIRLIKENRKSAILKQPTFGCLKGVPSINVTRGCVHSCVYCYARGFTDAPPKGEVHLYKNLPEVLESELSRKRRMPSWVSFSTASDCFQNLDEVLKTTYSCMKLLIERGIGVTFLTKGFIHDEFIGLFKKHPDMIKARVGIVSLNEEYKRLFEPFTASPLQRLINIKNLMKAGIGVSVRIDPMIPGVTDRSEQIEYLIKRLKAGGIKDISVSSLVMRPSIMGFFNELPSRIAGSVLRLYQGQPWQRVITSAKTRLLPAGLRITLYERIKKISTLYGVNTAVCGCKNPDLPWEFCSPWVERVSLFDWRDARANL